MGLEGETPAYERRLTFNLFSFVSFLFAGGRHMLQRVSLQHWQNVQSGQGFFLACSGFSAILNYITYQPAREKVFDGSQRNTLD